MLKSNHDLNEENINSDWITIHEAVKIARKTYGEKIKKSDIYRSALYGFISLSIYFQSPVILRKIQRVGHKIKLRPAGTSLISRLCLLDKNCFINERGLIISTSGKYITPVQRIIDTSLTGYEYVLVQQLLSRALKIPLPITGAPGVNYGITVSLDGELYQVFNRTTWKDRVEHQINNLPKSIIQDIFSLISIQKINKYKDKDYFPAHNLPPDAWFVIRHSELEKLINAYTKKKSSTSSISTRISTPLSRLLWLACKHNDAISPLIRQPYKLLSIFEEWASADGITDHLSSETLKAALKRGSPPSTSSSN
ncbi:hypothetical protein [Raoultella terrigena]|uniref:hypothetical protein n=1 Tax=Raoultella terrigena TaxID=577 RepID=UPI001F262E50|nr:hypothetical protein [Raoultella terrigena]